MKSGFSLGFAICFAKLRFVTKGFVKIRPREKPLQETWWKKRENIILKQSFQRLKTAKCLCPHVQGSEFNCVTLCTSEAIGLCGSMELCGSMYKEDLNMSLSVQGMPVLHD